MCVEKRTLRSYIFRTVFESPSENLGIDERLLERKGGGAGVVLRGSTANDEQLKTRGAD